MSKKFFSNEPVKTGLLDVITFRPTLECLTPEQLDEVAERFSRIQKYYEVRPVRPEAKNLAKAMSKYIAPESHIIVVADIYVASGQAMRKAYTRANADMDRGILKKGDCMGFAIFQLERNAPNFANVMFKLAKEYIENY